MVKGGENIGCFAWQIVSYNGIMETVRVPIKSLTPDPANARKHGKRNIDAIAASLARFGQQKPIVVDSRGVVWAGNGTLTAALQLGWSEIDIVRSELEGDDLLGFAIADNRTAELASWSDELEPLLKQLSASDDLIDSLGFSEGELVRLTGVGATEDNAPEPPSEAVTQPGDLWILGDHRLLCGDSTSADDVARLMDGAKPGIMVTDPPWGVNYDPSWREKYGLFERHSTDKVPNDDRCDWSDAWELFPGAVVYCWHADQHAGDVWSSLVSADLIIRTQIIWRKQHFAMSQGAYHAQHEPCWYAVRKGSCAGWAGDRTQSTVWDILNANPMGGKKDDSNTTHATQKPVECMARPIRNHTFREVYDPFLGSGTTLIAAEQLERRCYAMEISPPFVDVAVERWENFTGGKARRIRQGS